MKKIILIVSLLVLFQTGASAKAFDAEADLTGESVSLATVTITGTNSGCFVAGSTAMSIDCLNGRVGIGTTSPGSKLEVNGDSSFSGASTFQSSVTVNGIVNVSIAGSAASPSLVIGGSLNSGFFKAAPDSIGVSLAGAGHWEWSGATYRSNGLIGGPAMIDETTSATNPVFAPRRDDETTGLGSSSAGNLSIITSGSEAMRIASSGNVGIGTTAPTDPLTIRADANDVGIKYINGATGSTLWRAIRNASADSVIEQGYSGGAPMYQISTSGNSYFNGGNVGIGTIAPATKLQIENATPTAFIQSGSGLLDETHTALKLSNNDASANAVCNAYSVDSSFSSQGDICYVSDLDSNISGRFAMRLRSSDGSWAEKFSILDSGNVGIGTSAPTRALSISDTMNIIPRATAPTTPILGDIYVDSDTSELCFYDGTSWTGLKAGGACL